MQLDIAQLIEGLRKRWWLALLVALSSAAVAYLATDSQPRVYQAQVLLQAQPNSPDNAVSEYLRKDIVPSAAILRSKDFLRDVVDGRIGGGEPVRDVDVDALPGLIKTQPRPDDRIIEMTVDYRDGQTAALLADRIADAYVARRAAESQDNPGGVRVNWVKLQSPEVPAQPYQPRPRLYAAAAALFGLIVGLLLAIGLELLDKSLKTPADVTRFMELSTIGIIPRGKG